MSTNYSHDEWVSPAIGCKNHCKYCIALKCRALPTIAKRGSPAITWKDKAYHWTGEVHKFDDWRQKIKGKLRLNPHRLVLGYLGDIGNYPEDFWVDELFPYLNGLDVEVVLVTKRPRDLKHLLSLVDPKPHITVAVSVTNQTTLNKFVPIMLNMNVSNKIVWLKPLQKALTDLSLLKQVGQVEIAGLMSGDWKKRLHLPELTRMVEYFRANNITWFLEHGGGGKNKDQCVPPEAYNCLQYEDLPSDEELELMDREIISGCTARKRPIYMELIDWMMTQGEVHYLDIWAHAASIQDFKTKGSRDFEYLRSHSLVTKTGKGYWKLSL